MPGLDSTGRRRIAATVARRSGGTRLLGKLRARACARVLCYHRIAPDLLEDQLRALSRTNTIVSMDELVGRLERGKSVARLLAVTFDDGYSATVLPAADLAQRNGWPITVYLPTQVVDTGRPYWFTRLRLALEQAPQSLGGRDLIVAGQSVKMDSSAPSHTAKQLERILFHRPMAELDAAVASLADQLDVSEPTAAPASSPYNIVDWQRAAVLAANDAVTIGAHTVTHPFLATLDDAELHHELTGARDELQQRLGRPVDHFCYPYGDAESIGTNAPRIVRELYRSAVTMRRGSISAGADPWDLPRVPIYDVDSVDVALLKVATA